MLNKKNRQEQYLLVTFFIQRIYNYLDLTTGKPHILNGVHSMKIMFVKACERYYLICDSCCFTFETEKCCTTYVKIQVDTNELS